MDCLTNTHKTYIRENEHGIRDAIYVSDGSRYWPWIECLCGWTTGRQYDWESAGHEFDLHLMPYINYEHNSD